jgi:hypothetical protein
MPECEDVRRIRAIEVDVCNHVWIKFYVDQLDYGELLDNLSIAVCEVVLAKTFSFLFRWQLPELHSFCMQVTFTWFIFLQ